MYRELIMPIICKKMHRKGRNPPIFTAKLVFSYNIAQGFLKKY